MSALGERSADYVILGAGVMGSQIAAHFANAGVPSLLLDVTSDAAAQEARAGAGA